MKDLRDSEKGKQIRSEPIKTKTQVRLKGHKAIGIKPIYRNI
jgi:hypothetical protein